MKLRSLFEAKQPVEITQKPDRNAISAAWPQGVMYKGVNVFNAVYDSDLADRFQQMLAQSARGEEIDNFDAQESFLGYVPSKDLFVMGFDTWGDSQSSSYDDEDTEDMSSDDLDEHGAAANIPNLVAFRLNEQGQVAKALVWGHIPGRMMYGSGGTYNYLKREYPDMIDIRLD
jgi:hypothetical protein